MPGLDPARIGGSKKGKGLSREMIKISCAYCPAKFFAPHSSAKVCKTCKSEGRHLGPRSTPGTPRDRIPPANPAAARNQAIHRSGGRRGPPNAALNPAENPAPNPALNPALHAALHAALEENPNGPAQNDPNDPAPAPNAPAP